MQGGDGAITSQFDLATSCPRVPKADDAMRVIVVAHPDDASGNAANDWETLQLASTGTITRTNTHFTMGRGAFGTVSFTADGVYGYVAQDDGSIGAFKLSDGGVPTVIEAKHKDTYYATSVIVGPAGDHLYVMDAQTPNNGGGIYDVPIACDGTLGTGTLDTAADLPNTRVPLPQGDWARYARAVAGSTDGQTVAYRVTLGPPFWRRCREHERVLDGARQRRSSQSYFGDRHARRQVGAVRRREQRVLRRRHDRIASPSASRPTGSAARSFINARQRSRSASSRRRTTTSSSSCPTSTTRSSHA